MYFEILKGGDFWYLTAAIGHIPQKILVRVEVFHIHVWMSLTIAVENIFHGQSILRRFRHNRQMSLINWWNIPLCFLLLFRTSKIILDAHKDLRNAIFIRSNHLSEIVLAFNLIGIGQMLKILLIVRILVQISIKKAQTLTLISFHTCRNQKCLVLSCVLYLFFAEVKASLVLNSLSNFIENASSVKL